MAEITVLDVVLGDRPVGTLTRLPGERTLFAFDEEYVADPDRPILSLSYKDAFGELITDTRPVRQRVPAFFANMLPEGAMRQYLAERAGVKPEREFYLLWVLGTDLPGAVGVRPAETDAWPQSGDDARADTAASAVQRERALRFSLAGVQLKLSAVLEATGGLTIPAQGAGGSWIVKLPSATYAGVPENEYAMLQLASRIGIDVPETRLVEPSQVANLPAGMRRFEERALAIRRFDRTREGARVHVEDFAQVFGVFPDAKYGKASYRNIAEVLGIETSEADVAEFVRRLVFNVLIGNQDMHLKNWSLIYPDGRTPSLAPAYDFVSTIAYIPDDTAALKFARTRDVTQFARDELAFLANRARLPEKLVLETATDTVTRFLDTWQRAKQELPIPTETARAIEANLKKIPIVLDAGTPPQTGRGR